MEKSVKERFKLTDEHRTLSLDDIPTNGFTLNEEDESSILKIQDMFYQGIETDNIAVISTAIEHFVNKIILFLGKSLEVKFPFDAHNQPKKLAKFITENFDDATVVEYFNDGFDDAQVIFKKYHTISTGKSIARERKAEDEWDRSWRDEAFQDFHTLWDHFENWFTNELFIDHGDWLNRQRHSILSELLPLDSPLEYIEEQFASLNEENLEIVSSISIRNYLWDLISKEEYGKAELLLSGFSKKFTRTHEDMFHFHELKASIYRSQQKYEESLQELQSALEHTEMYGIWDYRYTCTMAEIIKLKTQLGHPIDSEIRESFLHKAKSLSDVTLLHAFEVIIIEKLMNSEFSDANEFEQYLTNIQSNCSTLPFSPKKQVELFHRIKNFINTVEIQRVDSSELQILISNLILGIATKYSRWDEMIGVYSELLGTWKTENMNIFKIEEYEEKKNSIKNMLERTQLTFEKSKQAIRSKNKEALRQLNDYFNYCVEEGHTLAVEILKKLEYNLAKKGDYDLLDEYNGESAKLHEMISYMNSRKYRPSREGFAQFRDQLIECAKLAGGLHHESHALGALVHPRVRKLHNSLEQELQYINTLIELNIMMGSRKMELIFKWKKADILDGSNRKEEAIELYHEVTAAFLEIEPINAFYYYANLTRRKKLYLSKPRDVLEFCNMAKSKIQANSSDDLEFNELQALAMICTGEPRSVQDAAQHLQESLETVLSKPIINDTNRINYQRVISTYLVIDILNNNGLNENLMNRIDANEHIRSGICFYHAGNLMSDLSTSKVCNGIHHLNAIADYLYSNNEENLAYKTYNKISMFYNTMNNYVEADKALDSIILPSIKSNHPFYALQSIRFYNDKENLKRVTQGDEFTEALRDLYPGVHKAKLLDRLGVLHGKLGGGYLEQALQVATEVGADRTIRGPILTHLAYLTRNESDILQAVNYNVNEGDFHQVKILLNIVGDQDKLSISFELLGSLINSYMDKALTSENTQNWEDCWKKLVYILTKFGKSNPEWTFAIIQRSDAIVEELIEQLPEYSSFTHHQLPFKVLSFHLNILQNFHSVYSEELWSSVFVRTLFWFKMLQKSKPKIYHRKLYNRLWKAMNAFFDSSNCESNDLCLRFVNHLQEHQDKLNASGKSDSLFQQQLIFPSSVNESSLQLLKPIVQNWENGVKFSERVIMNFSELLIAHWQEHPHAHSELFDILCKLVAVIEKTNKKKWSDSVPHRLQEFISEHYTEISILASANSSRYLNKYLSSTKSNPSVVYAKLTDSEFSQDTFEEIILSNISKRNLGKFMNEYTEFLISMDQSYEETVQHLNNFLKNTFILSRSDKLNIIQKKELQDLQGLVITAIKSFISDDESTSEDKKRTLNLKLAIDLFFFPHYRKSAQEELIRSLYEENKRSLNKTRANYYLQFIEQIVEEDDFFGIRDGFNQSNRTFAVLIQLARFAHSMNKRKIARRLYTTILISDRCSLSHESVTKYRMACLEDDVELGTNKLMNLIANKVEEGINVNYIRILLCMYLINTGADQKRILAIAKGSLGTQHARYFKQTECEIYDDHIKFGDERFVCEPNLMESLVSGQCREIQRYHEGFSDGNDMLFLGLNDENVIVRFKHYSGSPHVNIMQG